MNTPKVIILFLLYLLLPTFVRAQKENNVWAFGHNLGLNFNSTSPNIISTQIQSKEGPASICDTNGKLLFYTNGLSVWDNTHSLMPNGSGLLGPSSLSATQGAVIAPVIGHPNKYFIVTVEDFNGIKSGYIRYSVVDMTLNGGKGDIMPGIKNNLLDTGRSEKMILAQACNGLWLITHHIDSPIFYTYKIDNPFYIGKPVISKNLGIVHSGNYYVGEIKLSPDSKKIAMANYISPVYGYKDIPKIELFDFNKKTGIISNPIAIDSSANAYSVEFSPDNKKLYVCDFDSFIHQYSIDLLPNVSAVYASKQKVNGDNFSFMRLGPDGKIYVRRHNYFTELSRIHNPNNAAASCNMVIDDPALSNGGTTAYIGLGNSTIRPIDGGDTTIIKVQNELICIGDIFGYKGDDRYSEYLWHDGNTSNKRSINSAGKYWVSYKRGCTDYIDTINITTKEKNFVSSVLDTSFCFRKEYTVMPKTPRSTTIWDDSSKLLNYTFTSSGKKWVTTTNNDCNFWVDTFKVKLVDFDVKISDTFICTGEKIILDASQDVPATYLWQNQTTNSTFEAEDLGNYWVFVTVDNCSIKEEVTISKKAFKVNFDADTTICKGASVKLEVLEKDATIKWQDGSTNSIFVANQKGTYNVEITKEGCSIVESAYVNEVVCEDCIRIPNAFTPNGDNLNERFRVFSNCLIDKFSMMIYNRFGEQVFYSDNFNNSWDGTFNGTPLNTAVFYYYLTVRFKKPDAKDEIYKGDITLIR